MRITMKLKLGVSFGTILILTGTVGYIGLQSLKSTNSALTDFAAQPYEQVKGVNDLQTSLEVIRRDIITSLFTADPEKLAGTQAEYAENWQSVNTRLQDILRSMPEEGREMFKDIQPMMENLKAVSDETFELGLKADASAPQTGFTQTEESVNAVSSDLTKLKGRLPTTALSGAAARDAIQSIATLVLDARIQMAKALAMSQDVDIGNASTRLNEIDGQILKGLASLATKFPSLAKDAQNLQASWEAAFKVLRSNADTGVANYLQKATDAVNNRQQPLALSAAQRLDALEEYANKTSQSFLSNAASQFSSTQIMLIGLIVGAILLGSAAATWMAVSITRNLNKAVKFSDDIGTGEVSKQTDVRGSDEISDLLRSMNQMSRRLTDVVSEVRGSASQVASGSAQSAATAERLSSGSTEQAAASEQASAAVEEMAANVRQNADNASTTEAIASKASASAEKTGLAVTASVDAMRTIAQKISVVQEIARQTDLLALNAAIEAARAGAHGKGFAVVASEVRKLAERSQHAAQEIRELSAQTLSTSEEAGNMLNNLVPDIQRTADLVSEISAACREQSIGIEQINQAIQQLDQVTQSNAGAANEMSATAGHLSAEACRLEDSTSFFKLGSDAAPKPARLNARQDDIRALQAKVTSFAETQVSTGRAHLRARSEATRGSLDAGPNGSGFDMDMGSDNSFKRMSV